MKSTFIFSLILCLVLPSCKNKHSKIKFIEDEKIQKEFQERFIVVEDGGTIELPEGNYKLKKSLSLEGKNNITIKGKGTNKTILSFLAQTEGAEGINITNCKNITLENFTVQDAKGDNIKLKECRDVIIRKMNWVDGFSIWLIGRKYDIITILSIGNSGDNKFTSSAFICIGRF